MAKERPIDTVHNEELSALRRERNNLLIEKAQKEYAQAFRVFLLYQNRHTDEAPEFNDAELLRAGLKARGTLSASEINLRVEQKRQDIYRKAARGMVRLENILGKKNAEPIRQKVYSEIVGDLKAKGKEPILRWEDKK